MLVGVCREVQALARAIGWETGGSVHVPLACCCQTFRKAELHIHFYGKQEPSEV